MLAVLVVSTEPAPLVTPVIVALELALYKENKEELRLVLPVAPPLAYEVAAAPAPEPP